MTLPVWIFFFKENKLWALNATTVSCHTAWVLAMVVTRFPVTQPVSTGCGGYQHQQTCDPSHLNISYLISSGEPQLLSSSDFLGGGRRWGRNEEEWGKVPTLWWIWCASTCADCPWLVRKIFCGVMIHWDYYIWSYYVAYTYMHA